MNQPFGFSASDDDGRDDDRGRDPGGPGGFDPSQFGQFGQMLSQFGQMLGSMGSAMTGPGASGPVNYQLARTVALQALGRTPVVSEASGTAAQESVRLAELWLDETTVFPSGVHRTEVWTPQQWVEQSLPTWEKICTPVAEQMNSATKGAMPEEARQLAGPLLGMLDQMGGMGFGMQLGQGLGKLAPAVLFSSEVGLPFGDDGVAALCPTAIDAFAEELELPRQEVVVFLAAREAAHIRLFAGAPWLRARVLATVEEYARGIRVDTSGLDDLASGLDPSILQDPTKLQELLSGGAGAIGPKVTNVNEAALGRLETLLAWSRAGSTLSSPPRSVTDCPARTSCARCGCDAGPPVARPSRPSPVSSVSNCARGRRARPRSCGAGSERRSARIAATACGAIRTCSPWARTSRTPPR